MIENCIVIVASVILDNDFKWYDGYRYETW